LASLAFSFIAAPSIWLDWNVIFCVAGAVSFILSLVAFAFDISRSRRESVSIIRHHSPLKRKQISNVPAKEVVEHKHVDGADLAVFSPAVDRALRESDAAYDYSVRRQRIEDRASKYAYAVLRAKMATKNKKPFNGKVIRQDDDLDLAVLRNHGSVSFSASDYYSLMATNYMVEFDVVDLDNKVLLPGHSLICDAKKRTLKSIAESDLANIIGVSTLAFTSDGMLVLIRQGGDVESSRGLWAPSGSGSMDRADVRASRHFGRHPRLKDVVRYAMERELIEECPLPFRDIIHTKVIGYFRWVNKGGKPEYLGLTKLATHSSELPKVPRIVERGYVKSIVACEVHWPQIVADKPETAVEGIHSTQLSMPLLMGLRCAGNYFEENPQWLPQYRNSVTPPNSST